MIRVLWSGGFDSTALVVRTLLSGERVVPFVINMTNGSSDDVWQKQIRERDSRDRIRHALPAELRHRLEPEERCSQYAQLYPAVVEAWREITQRGAGGYSPQLPLIVAAAREIRPVSAGFVRGDDTLADQTHAPVLAAAADLPLAAATKSDLLADAERHGYRHLLDMTWSCESSDSDALATPCGDCPSCKRRIIPARGFKILSLDRGVLSWTLGRDA